MKRLILLGILALVVTPHAAKAWGEDNDRDDHKKIGATEMVGIGLGSAALLGLAGYLVLRRRKAA